MLKNKHLHLTKKYKSPKLIDPVMKTSLQKISLSVIAVIALINTSQAQCTGNVNIPDANLKAALLADTDVNTNQDAEIQCTEAEAYTGMLRLNHKQITDATGLEKFINITELNVRDNNLTSLNVSANTSLTALSCNYNQLTSLDVSANTALEELWCDGNSLTSLDVSANTALVELYCSSNQLTSIDVLANTALESLVCSVNPLASLDVSANTALTYLHCLANSLTSLDVSANTALVQLTCVVNSLTSLDMSANTALLKLYCDDNALTRLNLANNNNSNMTQVDMSNNPNLYCVQVDDENDSDTHSLWGASSQVLYKNNCGVGVAENEHSSTITLYPNPTAGRFTVAVPASQLGTKLELYNALGKLVLQTSLLQSTTIINIDDLSKGMYVVKTTNVQGNSTIQKLMAE
jgi:hypothetical protein